MHAHIHALITAELRTLEMLYQAIFMRTVSQDLAVEFKQHSLEQICDLRKVIEGILYSTTRYIENDSDERLARLARVTGVLSSAEVPKEMKDGVSEILAAAKRRQRELPKELSEIENRMIASLRASYAPMQKELDELENKFRQLSL